MKELGYDAAFVSKRVRAWPRGPDIAVYEDFIDMIDTDLEKPYLISWEHCLQKNVYNNQVLSLLSDQVYEVVKEMCPTATIQSVHARVRDILKRIQVVERELRVVEEAHLHASEADISRMEDAVFAKKAAERERTRRGTVSHALRCFRCILVLTYFL